MLSRLPIIKEFVVRELSGTIDLSQLVVERQEAGDYAAVTLAGRYGLSVKSPYTSPPLGEVILTDRLAGETISGPVNSQTWAKIAAHIKGTAPAIPAPQPEVSPEPQPQAVSVPDDGRHPWLGMPAIFIPRPGEGRAGQSEMACVVTKLNRDGTIGVTAYPHGSEVICRDELVRRNPSRLTNCWDFCADPVNNLIRDEFTAPIVKRGPGRPPKARAA